jgi:hypothetical protein
MSDAAQGEPPHKAVFSTPFKVQPSYELWDTPPSYRGYPGGKDLPAKTKVWRVQDSGMTYGSVVSFSYGFEDSPDAEILTPGFNTGKESGAIGVGRQGNFLQWGFSAPPSKMTEAGRCFFLNCICYIRQFEGKPPLIRIRAGDRLDAVRLAPLLNLIRDPRFASSLFPADLLTKYKGDADGLAKYYQERIERVYSDSGFRVDDDLPAMGLQSNRKIETLERLVELLDDPRHAPAARNALGRYTEQSFPTARQWREWLDNNRGRIYFTDVGGFKFLVAPQGYLPAR